MTKDGKDRFELLSRGICLLTNLREILLEDMPTPGHVAGA